MSDCPPGCRVNFNIFQRQLGKLLETFEEFWETHRKLSDTFCDPSEAFEDPLEPCGNFHTPYENLILKPLSWGLQPLYLDSANPASGMWGFSSQIFF